MSSILVDFLGMRDIITNAYRNMIFHFTFAKLLFIVCDIAIIDGIQRSHKRMLYIYNKFGRSHNIQLRTCRIHMFFNDHFAIIGNILFLKDGRFCRASFKQHILYADIDDIVWYANGAVHAECKN